MQSTQHQRLSPARLNATFAALADPTRRAILLRLARGEASVSELAEPFKMSQPAISKHLKVLKKAGLISRHPGRDHRDGRRTPSKIQGRPLAEVDGWLGDFRQFWEGSFGKLDQLLGELQGEGEK